MGRFIDLVEDNIKQNAEEFVRLIEDGSIRKRILSNQADEYSLESAYDNFIEIVSSPEHRKLMKEF